MHNVVKQWRAEKYDRKIKPIKISNMELIKINYKLENLHVDFCCRRNSNYAMAWIYLNYFRNYSISKYWKFLKKTLRILILFQVDSFISIFDIDLKELET